MQATVELAAFVALAGFDPARLLDSRDQFEVAMMRRIAQRCAVERDRRDDALAVRIANYVGKTLGG